MDSMNRRVLLAGGAGVTTAVLAGCLSDADENREPNSTSEPPQEQEYDADNPFSITLMNNGARNHSVAVEISRNGDTVYEDATEVDTGETITVAKYETTGRYTIRAETDDHQMETSAEIERENLISHRSASCRIMVDDDGVLIEVEFAD